MISQIIRKVISIIPLLFLVSVILFALINFLPGDASIALFGAGEGVTREMIEAAAADLGLNDPAPIRYVKWIGNIFKGDLGISFISNLPVTRIIRQRLPVTLELMLISVIVSVIIGIPLGIIAAVKQNTLSDYITSVVSVAGVAMPNFWTGILLILLFAITLGILPASGYMPLTVNPKQNLLSLILPAFTIGFSFSATITRQTRSAMLEVLNQDYIMTARSKGLLEKKVIWKHALKNAIIPVLAVIGMHMGRMISGAVVTEQVFMLPGMGKALVDSIIARDYPVVMAIVLMVVLGILIFNTLLDVLYIILDPRISRSVQNVE